MTDPLVLSLGSEVKSRKTLMIKINSEIKVI